MHRECIELPCLLFVKHSWPRTQRVLLSHFPRQKNVQQNHGGYALLHRRMSLNASFGISYLLEPACKFCQNRRS